MTDTPSLPDIATQLALQRAGPDVYRFPAMAPTGPWDGLYGGQVLALALRAAGQTVDRERLPHSLHAYFLRRGSSAKDMVLNVQRDTDGRSFSARRVTVLQDNLPIFTMAASFHVEEEGPDNQEAVPPPDVPDPETLDVHLLPGRRDHGLVEVRNIRDAGPPSATGGMPWQAWGRASGPVGDDLLLHACVLAHFADLYSGLPPMPGSWDRGGPSLDHAMWLHRPIRADDWFLMALEPVSTGRGRGVYRGAIWDRSGRLAATLTQEMLYSTSRPPRVFPPGAAEGDDGARA